MLEHILLELALGLTIGPAPLDETPLSIEPSSIASLDFDWPEAKADGYQVA